LKHNGRDANAHGAIPTVLGGSGFVMQGLLCKISIFFAIGLPTEIVVDPASLVV
jgi:hypothetical protein